MRLILLALAALLASTSADALDVNGRVGAVYLRLDETSPPPSSVQSTEPRLDLDLSLNAHGFIYRPDALDWRLGVAYRRISAELNGDRTSLQDLIFYNGRVSLFTGRTSPVALELDASRDQAEFSTSPALNVTGESVTQTAGATVSLRVADRPGFVAGYRRMEIETDTPGVGRSWRNTDRITGTLSTGTPAFDVNANYTGDFNDGTYQLDRSDLHMLNMSTRIPLGPSFQIAASDIYQALKPHDMVVGSIEQETNGFRLFGKNNGFHGDRQLVSYSYVHSFLQAFGAPLAEAARQGLRYEGDLLLTDPNLFTRWIVDGSVLQARNGPTELNTTGETLGVQLWWRRPSETTTYEVFGGPLVGYIQSDLLGDSNGWGVTGTARARFPWQTQSVSLSYTGDYGSELYGNPGWYLRQGANVSIGGPLGRGRYNASLTGSGYRTYSPLFPGSLSRNLDLYVTATSRDWSAEIRGTLQDGIAGSSPQEIVGDGLFIPAPFDSKSRQLTLRATRILLTGLSASGQFRYLNSVYPGQPSLNQLEALASIQYAYGALTVAIEDRYQRYEQPTGWGTANQIMFRVYRSIGWNNF